MTPRLCAVSVDLDEIDQYLAIHGLRSAITATGGRRAPSPVVPGQPGDPAVHAVYDVALARIEAWARRLDLPLTLFAVGADLDRPAAATRLRVLAAQGHEIANHTLDHRYDLVRLDAAEQRRQVEGGVDSITRAVGQPPVGFRAPGYTVSDGLLAVVRASGARYDASVFPCPTYQLAKLGALALMAATGRASRSIVGDPRVCLAPRRPYRIGRRYWGRGQGLVEVPVQVTPGARLPFIGTALTLAPAPVAIALARACAADPCVNLELHGIDFLDADDGLATLAAHQHDLSVPRATKLARLEAALGALSDRGFSFVTMRELAARCAA